MPFPRTIVAAVCTAASLAALGAAGGADAAKCKPGVHKIGGAQARTFCGPGSATVKGAGMNFAFKRGNCQKTSKYFTINLGTIIIGAAASRPDYFGITVGKTMFGGSPAAHDGTYSGGVVSFVHANQRNSVAMASITLTKNRSRGTFTGQLFSNRSPVSGTFRCK